MNIPLPHRWPMLFVDQYTIQQDNSIEAKYHVDPDLPFFKGHFPGYPIMPGVLLVETIAQAGGILVAHMIGNQNAEAHPLLTDIVKARFRKPVFPGDDITIRASAKPLRAGLYMISGEIYKEDTKVAEATVRVMVR